MRNARSGMATLLNAGTEFSVANVVTIAPVGGTVIRLTDSDAPVTVESWYDNASHTFSASGLAVTFGASKLAIGLTTDKKTLVINAAVDSLLSGLPWPARVQRGYFDGASVLIEKAITGLGGAYNTGTLIDFWGQVSEAKAERFQVTLDLASWLEVILAQNLPKNVFQTQCLHTLFDSGCTLSKAAYAVTGTAHVGSTASSIVTGLANPDDYFALGTLMFTSGVLNGQTRTVATYASGTAVVLGPFSAAPAVGDAFTAYPGCDKLQATCTSKFSNLAHFRGYGYLPTPENAL